MMTKDELRTILNSWDNLILAKNDIEKMIAHLPLLVDIALNDPEKTGWRATWLLDKINDAEKGIIAPWIPNITANLALSKKHGKKRQLLKIISLYPIMPEQETVLLDYCLGALSDSENPPAVRAHAMQILYNISQSHPDLKEELLAVMEQEIEIHESPGIKARAKKIAALLKRDLHKKQNFKQTKY